VCAHDDNDVDGNDKPDPDSAVGVARLGVQMFRPPSQRQGHPCDLRKTSVFVGLGSSDCSTYQVTGGHELKYTPQYLGFLAIENV